MKWFATLSRKQLAIKNEVEAPLAIGNVIETTAPTQDAPEGTRSASNSSSSSSSSDDSDADDQDQDQHADVIASLRKSMHEKTEHNWELTEMLSEKENSINIGNTTPRFKS